MRLKKREITKLALAAGLSASYAELKKYTEMVEEKIRRQIHEANLDPIAQCNEYIREIEQENAKLKSVVEGAVRYG